MSTYVVLDVNKEKTWTDARLLQHVYHCMERRSLTYADFVRDVVVQDERSDEVLEYDRQDDTLVA